METSVVDVNTVEVLPLEEELNNIGLSNIPFKSRLSFAPLLKYLEQKQNIGDSAEIFLAQEILRRVKEVPAFQEPIDDLSILDDHRDLLELMMLAVLPSSNRENNLAKISVPFRMDAFFATKALQELMMAKQVKYVFNSRGKIANYDMVIRACSQILNHCYGQNLDIETLPSISIQHPHCPLLRHYKLQLDGRFLEIKQVKPLKPLSQSQINQLLSNVYDIDLWLEYVPPENFEFHGLVVGNLVDITEEESLSRLKHMLLERDAVVNPDKMEKLEEAVRAFFFKPQLKLGLTAIDYPLDRTVSHRYKIRFDFLADEQRCLLSPENANSLYEKVCKYREILIIEDLKKVNNPTPIEKGLLKKGLRSIIAAPLFNKDNHVIGIVEIGSPNAYDLHSFSELKFKEIIGLFSMAVERSRDEIDNRIEAVIREQYTALHPSVEWKFIETSYNLLEKRDRNESNSTADPIVFHDVYPLYGQSDIVSSSTKRNGAIQADLIDNLNRARKVLVRILDHISYPLADRLCMLIDRSLESLEGEFNSNDESRIVEFLEEDVHPLLKQVRKKYPDLAGSISSYFDYLDEELGIVYRKRKAYEESVVMINETISTFLEKREKESQLILPHYFEKYKTDGVEYDLYLGQSLLKKDEFSQIHLRNFRLWQLIDMCEITRSVFHMQKRLPVPLTTAQLVFVYSNPLSIRFRMDEKQFDVDGAYNVRYEILKKRIDKAVIEGTDERLTTSGKVAIVYLQEKDRQEYLDYIDYLNHKGYIEGEVEDLQLGRLQGVHGLRALRFTVKVQ